MSIIALRTDGEYTWLEIEGQSFFITPNPEHADEICIRCVEDLEFLRETVGRKISAIKYQSDDAADVKASKVEKLERALANVGVGVCDHTEEVHYEGVDLVIGYNFDHDECHRHSPAYLEVISITHRGQDITGLIDLLGGSAGFDKIADLLEGDK